MSNVREINIKNRTYYVSDGMINIKNLDPNNSKVDKKPILYQKTYIIPKNQKYSYLLHLLCSTK